MPLSPKSLAGPGYIVLNVLRGMNIIGLLAVIAASFVMLVKTVITSKFFFFDAVSHVVTATVSMLLIISETRFLRGYIARNWPLLSPSHGFVTLGLAMLVLGVETLGNLNKAATSQKSLGLGFWRIVIGSGILVMILGVFNIIASYVFRDRELGITARQVRAKGAVAIAQSEVHYSGKAYSFETHSSSGANNGKTNTSPTTYAAATPVTTSKDNKKKSRRFTRFGLPILPLHRNNSNQAEPSSPSSRYSEVPERREMQISAPLNINPHFEHLVRPDLAHHPSRVGQAC